MFHAHACRRSLPLVAALVTALFLTACGVTGAGDPNTAAVVNDEEIPVELVEQRFESVSQNPQAAQQLEADTEGVVQEQIESQIVTELIRSELLVQAAEDEFGITVDEEAIAAQREEIIEQVGGEEQFEQLVEQNNLSEEDVERLLRQQVYSDRIVEELTSDIEVTDEQVAEFYEQNADTRFGETVSARHVLVETRQQAQQVLRRLEGGEDFAQVAQDVSIDPSAEQNAGDLGQLTAGQTVPAFEEAAFGAEVGELVGPVETEFGFHVIEVTDRTPAQELSEVSDQIREELRAARESELLPAWLEEQAADAEVEVNPRFGTWDVETLAVVADEGLGGTEPEATPPAPGGATPPAPAPGTAPPPAGSTEPAPEATP